MPDGEMRRPPQLWEQRLTRMTGVISVGLSQSGDNTAIVPPEAPPGGGGGVEPAPVAPPPGTFSQPSRPNLIGGIQGITVLWDGLNADGDLYPYDTSFIEVHTSTSGTGFTVGTATLKGRLARPGGVFVGGLAAGTAHSFRFRGVDPAGNVTVASLGTATQTGLTKGPDIDAGAVTTDKLTAGTINGFFIGAGTISGNFITAGTVDGNFITGGTVQGSRIQTGASGSRVVFNDTQGGLASVTFFNSSNSAVAFLQPAATHLFLSGKLFSGSEIEANNFVAFAGYTGASVNVTGNVSSATLTVSGANVDMIGVFNNNTTGIDNVGIVSGTGKLRRISSSQDIKYDVTPITGTLSASVDADRVSDVVTVDPLAILDVAVTEFSVIDDGQPTDRRVLGFIAEDVADKLPIAVTRDADGQPLGVLDTSLVASLLAVAQQQQATIEDLRTRIEALEV